MKIICFSDTHGRPPVVPQGEWDALLHAGDFYDRLRKTSAAKPSEQLREWISKQSIPMYVVRGNHDVRDEDNLWHKANNPSENCMDLGQAWLVGAGWSGDFFYETPCESDLQKVCDRCIRAHRMKAIDSKPVILLAHYPPDYIPYHGDARNWLYKCMSELISYLQPKLVICGHLHHDGPKFRMDGNRMTLFPGKDGIGVQLLGDALQLI